MRFGPTLRRFAVPALVTLLLVLPLVLLLVIVLRDGPAEPEPTPPAATGAEPAAGR